MSSNDAALIPRQYANPPVREAIFTVSFQEALPLNIVEDFCQAEWATQYYPQTLPVIEVALQMGETATATPTTQVLGRRLRAEEGQKTLLHVTKTQFAFHNFDKYLGWDKACAAFLEAWNQFVTNAGVSVQMASLGVRYINEIHLPKEAQSEPHLYLQLLPSVPAEFPQPVRRFFIQIETLEPAQGLQGVVTETLLPPGIDKGLSVLIDVNSTLSVESKLHLTLTEMLAKTRAFKNRLFESCLTDNTRNLFN